MNLHESSDHIHFVSASILLGFASMAAQIILFREMMVAFYGNELTLGIMLCVWLLWVGVGSAVGNKIAIKWEHTLRGLSLWYLVMSIAILMTVVVVRFSKQILGSASTEIIGLFPMLLFALGAMSPLCLILGITFVLNSKVWTFDETVDFSVNKVYLWESLGAALAGILVTLVLIPGLSNFSVALVLFLLNVAFWSLSFSRGWRTPGKIVLWTLLVLAIGASLGSNWGERLDRYTAGKMWRNLPLVYSQDTKYGNVAVTRQQEQITFYENGLMLFSYPDDFSAEEAVHFALLEHPHPRSLLLIGGGMGGALSEALQYDSLLIDYVEIDPELIRMGKERLPEPEVKSLTDPRVQIHFMDGRFFVRRNLQADNTRRYDVVIVNLPDPSTAQLNRLYTVEFFDMIRSTLNRDGVFSFKASSAENYISGELSLYLSSLYNTLKSVFAEVKVLPGANAVFLASNKTGALFDEWEIMVTRLKDRGLTTLFLNENFLPDRLSPLRLTLLDRGLSGKEGKLNSDLRPICYFYNSVLWSKQFGSIEKQILLYLSGIGWFWLIAGMGLLFALLFFFCLVPGWRTSNLALAAIFVAGFTSIGVEIIVVLSFQTFHGYVYSMIGLIFTLFMLGLFLGAMIIQRMTSHAKGGFRRLIRVQLLQVLFLLTLLAVILALANSLVPDWVILLALLLTVSISGILGGMLFTSANHLFLSQRSTLKAGTGYAADLFGSSLSSLLASAILIPLLGIPASLTAILLVNLVCLFALLMFARLG